MRTFAWLLIGLMSLPVFADAKLDLPSPHDKVGIVAVDQNQKVMIAIDLTTVKWSGDTVSFLQLISRQVNGKMVMDGGRLEINCATQQARQDSQFEAQISDDGTLSGAVNVPLDHQDWAAMPANSLVALDAQLICADPHRPLPKDSVTL